MQELIGQDLGRYHIIERLGEGGMATVFKAFDTRLEREVAVKVIRREAFSPDVVDRMLQRFEREAKALSKLIHANIVPIIDYGDEGGSPYLVMPLIDGGTLKDRLASQVFSVAEAARILAPIARALDYAHSRGILHRDVKPSNILLTNSGDPMLSDFGVAKILEEGEAATLTGTGVGLGTPEYMAPEQWVGKATAASDQYSLGVVFYEMITGHKPYTAETPIAVLLKQSNEPLPRPRLFVKDLAEEVEQVLFKALSKNPDDRYQSMVDFSKALVRVAGIDTTGLPSKKETERNSDRFPTFDQLDIAQSTEPTRKENSTVKQNNGRSDVKSGIYLSRKFLVIFFAAILVVAVGILSITNGWFSPRSEPQEATEAYTSRVSEKDGMVLINIPAGEFSMGARDGIGDANEHPQHRVYLDSYWIDQTEVTNVMYSKCVSDGACTPLTNQKYYSDIQFDNHPVVYVNWFQAKTYCEWAGRRLPTEAEWEKAANGMDGSAYPWGDGAPTTNLANYNNFVGGTTEVGAYPDGKSFYGVLDLAGNVSEWVADSYSASYYSQSPDKNPQGPEENNYRVLRGGSWISDSNRLRASSRVRYVADFGDYNNGFRCALSGN